MLSSNTIFQNAWVVDDLEQTINYWVNTMGVGPFYMMEYEGGSELEYRGQTGVLRMRDVFWPRGIPICLRRHVCSERPHARNFGTARAHRWHI
ncbi:MAG: hypothetical protein ACI9UU_002832 [Candidatus Azotimanducaceae bacterium]|jgi:hypothetical protein